MKLYIIFTFLGVYLSVVLGAPSSWDDAYMNMLSQYCGSRLSNELAILCSGKYNDAKGSPKRQKRGIVDECCRTPCSRNYMKINYCAPDVPTITDSPIPNSQSFKVDYLRYYYQLVIHVLDPMAEDGDQYIDDKNADNEYIYD
ncbi:bombyxin B-8-like [Rhopalosiphum maidis]|uniref:bombyxin B-8-like n=1 Tax=Rhopalosiphum maidis TaxID=43146 RepID=UPI000EFDE723|nr:bombyxin B-8-like [Rhopalosiphum maidis]